ncbi:MAG TPA: hypothetical protein VK741_23635 [Acetobacteraceae bacterium]|jgi:hypothetical protein|nr:hypothetical protein [Acetobacteraceae bacterium]
MWVMLNDSFLSIVAHRSRKNLLLVRARQRADIEVVFPHAKITRTPKADYEFRASITRRMVERAMVAEVRRIDYFNFKSSVADQRRHNAYLDVWVTMMNWAKPPTTRTPLMMLPYEDPRPDDEDLQAWLPPGSQGLG